MTLEVKTGTYGSLGKYMEYVHNFSQKCEGEMRT